MILVKKIVNWCYKENEKEISERNRVYIPCKDFFLHTKTESKINCERLYKILERA